MLIDVNTTRAGPFAGDGKIAGSPPGIVTVAGSPASRPVFLIDRISLRLVAETISEPDGTWSISGLNRDRLFLVLALDPTGQFNAVIRDNITPAEET